ncbi:Protein of unknown function (DUF2637) [Mycobacterium sp. JS623]|uniref:Protein of unknown function (DUF2637) n=1 Tax=Mycobacterium sp. JS623 TaxID=212767 RepID=UPI0002A55C06|nr:Protein of unknown function (DUF2637) [Mycobacterium sp. JS623]AGB21650.1 Protein of unknown function (DUF2637) [Mycobacterium sp. JS623]
MTTQADMDAKNRRTARRFFWTLLLLATATSLYGNIAHAIGASESVHLNRVIAASIAPIFLMALVHGLAHLARNTASGLAYGLVVALVGGVAMFAFAQSYGALTAFARDANVLASGLTPLIVDATIAVSTFALVVLGDKPVRRARVSRSATSMSKVQVREVGSSGTSAAGATRKRDLAPQTAVSAVGKRTQPATLGAALHRDVAGLDELAVALVESKTTRQPVATVRVILEAESKGVAPNRIAKDVGVHHTAVKRILDAAAAANGRDADGARGLPGGFLREEDREVALL